MGRILAIDYGQKRVGIAVTDLLQLIANPLTTVQSTGVIDFLTNYLKTEQVECIVIGDPKRLNNKPSESAVFVDAFVKQLRKQFPEMKIEMTDERFTSKIASQAILAAGLKRKDRQNKELVDAVSAALILQSFMETKKGRI